MLADDQVELLVWMVDHSFPASFGNIGPQVIREGYGREGKGAVKDDLQGQAQGQAHEKQGDQRRHVEEQKLDDPAP